MESVGKKTGQAVATGVKGFAAAATAVGGFGAAAVKAGMNFDATMSEVSAISGATGSDFDTLRDKALEMGAKTKFSASEAASAMTYMGMAGWKTKDMLGGIAGIMNLAAASGEDLASTSDIVTNALTAFGMSASESGHFADILATASSNANTDVHMMGESFKYAAPVLGTLGYSAEDAAVALGLMGNSGIQASMAGTSLKTAMLNMTSPTKAMAGVMSQYGISLTDANGEMYTLGEVMGQLRDKMGGLDETTKAAAASTLFGKEAAAGMLAVINAAPEDFDRLTLAIENCNGSAEKMAATMIDNLQGDLTLLGSAFESLQIAISDSLTPTLREFAQFGQKAMANLLEGFQGSGVSGFMTVLSSTVTDGVTMLAGKAQEFASVTLKFIEAMANGILGAKESINNSMFDVIDTVTTGVGDWLSSHSTELADFGLDIVTNIFTGFERAGWVISQYIGDFVPLIAKGFMDYHESLFVVGTDILSGIGQGIIENKDQIKEWASNAISNMAIELRREAPNIIEGGLALLEALAGAIVENLPLIIATGSEIIARLATGIAEASPAVQAVIGTAVLPHILKIVDVVTSIGGAFDSVVNLVSGGINTVLNIGGKLMGGIQTLFGLITAHPVVAVVTAIIAAIVLLWNNCEAFRNAVGAIWEAITGFFVGAWEAIKKAWDSAGKFFSDLWDGIKKAFADVVDFFKGLFESAAKAVQDAWNAIGEFFSDLWESVKEIFAGVAEFFSEIFGAAAQAVQDAWNAVVEFFQGVWDGIQAVFSTVAEVLGGFFTAAWTAIQSVWGMAMEFFSSIASGIYSAFEAVTQFLSNAFSTAWGIISGIWGVAVAFFQGVWDGIQSIFSTVAEVIGGFFQAAWEAVQTAWSAVVEFFTSIWEGIQEVFASVAEWFGDIFTEAWEAITNVWDEVTDFFEGVWEDIKGVFADVWDAFKDIGGNMLKGLWEGVTGAFGWVKEKLGGVVDGIIGVFTGSDGFDIHSPSRVFADIGENLMRGLEGGAKDSVGLVKAQMLATVDTMKNAFSNIATIFSNIGHNAMNALTNSLGGAIDNLASKVASLMNKITSAAKKALKIKSPSKVWAEIGEFMALGLEQGWENEYPDIQRSIENGLNFGTTSIGVVANGSYNSSRSAQEWPETGRNGAGGTTVNIYSPVAVDAVQAAREWKKTAQRMALGYV